MFLEILEKYTRKCAVLTSVFRHTPPLIIIRGIIES